MRRFLRILLNAATVVSLLLGAATIVLWVRSHSTPDQFARHQAWPDGDRWIQRSDACGSTSGRVWFAWWHFEHGPRSPYLRRRTDQWGRETGPAITDQWRQTGPVARWTWRSGPVVRELVDMPRHRRLWPVVWDREWIDHPRQQDFALAMFAAVAPHWALLLAFAPLPLVRAATWTRRRLKRRGERGRCAACGYDLRATPDRCPECGAVPPATPTPTKPAAQQPGTATLQKP